MRVEEGSKRTVIHGSDVIVAKGLVVRPPEPLEFAQGWRTRRAQME